MANNRKCLLCGAEYSYCPACAEDRRKPSWMAAYEKEDCKIIFETLSAYGMNRMSVSEAKKAIKNIDINSINLSEQKKEIINEILGNKSSVVETPVVEVAETPAPIVDITTNVESIEETNKQIADDNVEDVTENVYVPYKKRNKNYKEENISE